MKIRSKSMKSIFRRSIFKESIVYELLDYWIWFWISFWVYVSFQMSQIVPKWTERSLKAIMVLSYTIKTERIEILRSFGRLSNKDMKNCISQSWDYLSWQNCTWLQGNTLPRKRPKRPEATYFSYKLAPVREAGLRLKI